ncbi:hemerythrin domain-containing protein [Streptomyces sp. TRM49041]|uniref:hemerythrin domain-containing protein n=1 Tax=Streptomyces sp. TRM49041 TaxID=2603216 RepID=UPI001656867D|nr:hemerythrin domain-containing protein [Streptomyces sp. TRM49041]
MGGPRAATEDADIVQELTAGHREVQRLFDLIRASEPGGDVRRRAVERVGAALARHADVERRFLHPAVRTYVPDGERWAAAGLAAHAETARVMAALAGRDPAGEEATELVLTLTTVVTRHVLDQEQRLFPRVWAACPPEVLRDLGLRVRRARGAPAPRLSPTVPDSPRELARAARRVGVLDRVRSALTRRRRTG